MISHMFSSFSSPRSVKPQVSSYSGLMYIIRLTSRAEGGSGPTVWVGPQYTPLQEADVNNLERGEAINFLWSSSTNPEVRLLKPATDLEWRDTDNDT